MKNGTLGAPMRHPENSDAEYRPEPRAHHGPNAKLTAYLFREKIHKLLDV